MTDEYRIIKGIKVPYDNTIDYTQEIESGIRLLDRLNPNWIDRIDIDTLDMGNCYSCVLGQLYGNYSDGRCVLYGNNPLKNNLDQVRRNGFSLGFGNYENFTEEWIEKIKQLKGLS